MLSMNHYPFSLPPLPYSYNALEPFIDEETMYYHHDKHFKTYIDNLNKALEKYPEYQSWTLETLLKCIDRLPDDLKVSIRNDGGGAYNHDLYFDIMRPAPNSAPSTITKPFGGIDGLKALMKKAGLGRFGSGFAWLALDCNQNLKVFSLPNQDSPLSYGMYPLLPMDVWEHAYYLKYRNQRDTFIDNWFNVVDWNGVKMHYLNVKQNKINYCNCDMP